MRTYEFDKVTGRLLILRPCFRIRTLTPMTQAEVDAQLDLVSRVANDCEGYTEEDEVQDAIEE
ncbi:MAG: hypothetical protein GF334_08690, partial [Candidatus Altiarchaeales archaeon]|nr:hypothetical protein [Candidatus Altiarchaeales archaeon]